MLPADSTNRSRRELSWSWEIVLTSQPDIASVARAEQCEHMSHGGTTGSSTHNVMPLLHQWLGQYERE